MLDFETELSQPNISHLSEFIADANTSLMREVYLINDNFTPMEFVADLLMKIFKMDVIQAERVTRKAHLDGKALCGKFPKDLAETMACSAMELAQKVGHPLLLITGKAASTVF